MPIRHNTDTAAVIWISTQPTRNYSGDTEKVLTCNPSM